MSTQLLTPEMRSNFRHLYWDVIWFGVISGSTIAFLSVFAARLGASSFEVSLLTAGPAIVNLFFSLPLGRVLEQHPLTRATYRSSIYQRLGYLLMIPLPWLFSEYVQVWALILITLVMSIPGTLLAVGFNAVLADTIPPHWRGAVVGRRNALLSLTMTLSSLLCGQILDKLAFPQNYQIVFALGAASAFMSSYHIGKLKVAAEPIERVGRPLGDLARPGQGFGLRIAAGLRFLIRSEGGPLLRLDLLRNSFGKLLAVYFCFYTFQYMGLPIFPLYNVRVLNLSDGAISLGNALFYLLTMLVSLRLSSLSSRFGHRKLLVAGALLFGQYPLLLSLARDEGLFWLVSITGGAVWGILNGGIVNYLMERVPVDDRPAHMTLHNLVLNLGILMGSLAGPVLVEWTGFYTALQAVAGLRFLAGIFLLLWA
jgi:MFS family permease